MYVNLSNKYRYAVDAIGVYLSDTAITGIPNFLPLPVTPQINSTIGFISDTLNWMLVSGDYIASGGENFLIIGNFKDDANTDSLFVNSSGIYDQSYIYIDQVSFTPCTPTSVNEAFTNDRINIYSNPVNDVLVIGRSGLGDNGELIIYNTLGEKVFEKRFIPDMGRLTINVVDFAPGIYFVQIKNNEGISTAKFIKE
jgi:hypothetical protein